MNSDRRVQVSANLLLYVFLSSVLVWSGDLGGEEPVPALSLKPGDSGRGALWTAEDLDLLNMPVAEISQAEVFSAAKKPEGLFVSKSAAYVISNEEIRRSGATTIPDVLRLAPGVQVAQLNTTSYALSIRGFNSAANDKMLVMVDGRSVFLPIYTETRWGMQDILLEDVERIEVIRGPGGTLWGANAVNGIINIITRHSRDTQGAWSAMRLGTEEDLYAAARYGGHIGDDTFYRIYGKYADSGDIVNEDEEHPSLQNNVHNRRVGFRLDSVLAGTPHHLSLLGQAYHNDYAYHVPLFLLTPPYSRLIFMEEDLEGFNTLAEWCWAPRQAITIKGQVYYDYVKFKTDLSEFDVHTLDLDLEQHFAWRAHEFIVQVNYRLTSDTINDKEKWVKFDPSSFDMRIYSLALQDEITVRSNLWLTLGAKYEYDSFSKGEWMPNIRLGYMPDAHRRHFLWAAISHAFNIPSRAYRHASNPISLYPPGMAPPPYDTLAVPGVITSNGSNDYNSEKLVAYEVGYRFRPANNLFLDVAAFYNDYVDLKGFEFDQDVILTEPTPYLDHRTVSENSFHGESYGGECALIWDLVRDWRLKTVYTFIDLHVSPRDVSTDSYSEALREGSTPQHQLSVGSLWKPYKRLELDLWTRYVDSLKDIAGNNVPGNSIDSYLTLDAHASWTPSDEWRISLVGRNLLDHRHREFNVLELERSLYAKLEYMF